MLEVHFPYNTSADIYFYLYIYCVVLLLSKVSELPSSLQFNLLSYLIYRKHILTCVSLTSSVRADGRGEPRDDRLHEDGAHIGVRSVSRESVGHHKWCDILTKVNVLLSCWSRPPSRLQDNILPMSPDDYKALSQYVSPRDIDAVVSNKYFNFLP